MPLMVPRSAFCERVFAGHRRLRRLVRIPRAERALRQDRPHRLRVRQAGVVFRRAIERRVGQRQVVNQEDPRRPIGLARRDCQLRVRRGQAIDDDGRGPSKLAGEAAAVAVFAAAGCRWRCRSRSVAARLLCRIVRVGALLSRRNEDSKALHLDRRDVNRLAQDREQRRLDDERLDAHERRALAIDLVVQHEPAPRHAHHAAQLHVELAQLDGRAELLRQDSDDLLSHPRLLPAVHDDGRAGRDDDRRDERDANPPATRPQPHDSASFIGLPAHLHRSAFGGSRIRQRRTWNE